MTCTRGKSLERAIHDLELRYLTLSSTGADEWQSMLRRFVACGARRSESQVSMVEGLWPEC